MNCPAQLAKETDECKKTRAFVESQDKCGNKAGDVFIIDFNFWWKTYKKQLQEDSTATTVDDE